MDQNPNQFWSVAQESWGKALAAFSHLGAADGAAPQLSFDPEKVKELQSQYINEATELWNQSLQGRPQVKDRRFSTAAAHCSTANWIRALVLGSVCAASVSAIKVRVLSK